MKEYGRFLSFLILIGGIGGLIYPAFIQTAASLPGGVAPPPPSITQAIISIFLQPSLDFTWFTRVVCLIGAVGSGYILLIHRLYRNIPITAVRTKVEFTFSDQYATARTRREQTLKANQKGVTAYVSKIHPTTPTGIVPRESITLDATCSGNSLGSNTDIIESGRGFDIIQEFAHELPFNVLMPIMPRFLFNRDEEHILSAFRNLVAFRGQTALYKNEFDVAAPQLRLLAANYPQHNVTVVLNFIVQVPSTLKVRRLKNTGVLNVPYKILANGTSVHVFVPRLERETLVISWDGKEAMIAAAG